MAESPRKNVALFGVGIILACFALTMTYVNERCSSNMVGFGTCPQTIQMCAVGAAYTTLDQFTTNEGGNGETLVNTSITCPWRFPTSFFATLSYIISLIFLTKIGTTKDMKDSVAQLGLISSIGLLLTLILMIIDVNDGSAMSVNGGGPLMQIPFVITLVLVGLAFLLVTVMSSQGGSVSDERTADYIMAK